MYIIVIIILYAQDWYVIAQTAPITFMSKKKSYIINPKARIEREMFKIN